GGVLADLLSVRAVFFLTTAGGLAGLPLLLAVVTDRAIAEAEAAAGLAEGAAGEGDGGPARSGGDGDAEDEPAVAVTP
ncbi:MAG TPA: hypothetical protein VIL36_19665, partial [Acidimicrobiales bacterium]